jgi:hypothetical protein
MSNSTLESLSSTFASANRGPLTTIFTPPTSCLSETILLSFPTTLSGSAETFTTTKVFINHFSWGIPACDSTTTATIDGSTKWNSGYYYCMLLLWKALSNKCLESELIRISSTRNLPPWMDVSLPNPTECILLVNDLGH